MHIELRHLRTIRAIHAAGGLARAAEQLNITQSALSHQIRGLEDQAGVELFARRARPMRLTGAGMRLLALAERVLPDVDALSDEFAALRAGRTGRLVIAIECHACFDWLLPGLGLHRRVWPDVAVDIRPGLAFGAMAALERAEVDRVVTSDPEQVAGIGFHALFDYHPMCLMAAGNPLAARAEVTPADLGAQHLITYPVDRARLDVFTAFLDPAGIEPRSVRQVELTAVIEMLVAADRGVAVLPDWVLRRLRDAPDCALRPLAGRPQRRLFAAIRAEDAALPYLAHFLRLARTEPVKLQRG